MRGQSSLRQLRGDPAGRGSHRRLAVIVLLAVLALLAASLVCGAAAPAAGAAPVISTLSASHGLPGSSLTITGSGFLSTGTGSSTRVYFGTTAAATTSLSATSIVCTVPDRPGAYGLTKIDVRVATGGIIAHSNLVDFTVDEPLPHIASVSIGSAYPGAQRTIYGSHFGETPTDRLAELGTGGVGFYRPVSDLLGTSCEIVSWSDTAITFKAPNVSPVSGSLYVRYRKTVGSALVTTRSNALSFTIVMGPTVTAPTGLSTQVQGGNLSVTWTTNAAVSTGLFVVYASAPSGDWIGKIVPQNGTSSYATNLALTVPAGGPYRIKVVYRLTEIGDVLAVGESPGTFTVTLPTITVTAPTGTSARTQGSSLAVSWTTSAAICGGEFAVWASGPSGWHIGKLVPQNGTASYATNLALTVPAGGPYTIRVGYRPSASIGFTVFAASPGTFTVTLPTITVTAPSGTSAQVQGGSLAVSWTTSVPICGGEFAVWATSASGWYIGKIVPQNGTASYATNVTLNLPLGGPYRIVVGYRPTASIGFTVFAASPGTFTVALPLLINVTVPFTVMWRAQNDSLPVAWETNQVVSSGEFAVWATGARWYIGKIVPQNGTASYLADVTLNVPVGFEYKIRVGWRPTVGSGSFTVFGASYGSVIVQ